MTTTVKGLLKGFRYISQIFDSKEAPEMQIGYPTDVKHVAHIGWDGPSVNPPTWMNEFRSAPLSALGAEAMADQPARFPSQDMNSAAGGFIGGTPLRDPPIPKTRRHSSSGAVPTPDSPTRSPGVPKHRRRNKSVTGVPLDSEGGGGGGDLALGKPGEWPVQDRPLIPRIARKKKPKAGGGGGSSRSGKSRTRTWLSDGGEEAREGCAEGVVGAASPERVGVEGM